MTVNRQKLVVVGHGRAGARVVEEILKRAPERFHIVMFGALALEPRFLLLDEPCSSIRHITSVTAA